MSLHINLTIFLYGRELFDNFLVWLWAQNQFYLFFTVAMAYRWKFFLWKSFEMFLTIFLYGFELFWQFYCMAMTLQIYQQKVWQFSCVVFWQFSCLDFWQFSCLVFWQFSGSPFVPISAFCLCNLCQIKKIWFFQLSFHETTFKMLSESI